jgi:hypothetical protein
LSETLLKTIETSKGEPENTNIPHKSHNFDPTIGSRTKKNKKKNGDLQVDTN